MFLSYRLGFATNSSSAHSIILHSDQKFLDQLDGYSIEEAAGIGRDTFSFTDKENKLAYLIWLHDMHGRTNKSAHEMMELARTMTGFSDLNLNDIRERVSTFETESSAYEALCPDSIDLGLWLDFMVHAPVAIHGYDDNEGAHFDKVTQSDKTHVALSNMSFKQEGRALIGYNNRTGEKFRWSRESYTKSIVPELVDLKITDYCGWGCKFCYQGSTKNGKHAPIDDLKATVSFLAAAGVFEIAIGGGEPVEHPDFAELLTFAKKKGITISFTTYGIEWAKDPDHPVVKAMKDGYWSGGIGVSVHSLKDVDKVNTLSEYLRDNRIWGAQVMAQTVVGATPLKATQAILESCIKSDRPLLMLGYKTTGRGASFTQRAVTKDDINALLTRAKEHIHSPLEISEWGYTEDRMFSLSVDTAFLDNWGNLLDEVGIPQMLRTSPEGKFSMYIDGVTGQAAPSSYCDKSQYVPWETDKLKEIFATF